MLQPNNVYATWVYAIHRTLTESGLDAHAVMRAANFDFDQLDSKTQQIPKRVISELWAAAENATNDDAFCLRAMSHVSDSYINALITSAQSCETVRQALELLVRYVRLVLSDADIRFTTTDSHLKIILALAGEQGELHVQDVDITFGMIAKYGSVLPIDEVLPQQVYLARKTPRNHLAYAPFFRCPVRFESEENAILFPVEVVDQIIPSASPVLSHHVQQYLAEQLPDAPHESLRAVVQREIVELLPEGTPKLKALAQRLNLSERTMQRRLRDEEGVSFSELLAQTRVGLAREHLQVSDYNVEEVATLLGFTEAGNFIRFFKQHTGETPHAFAK